MFDSFSPKIGYALAGCLFFCVLIQYIRIKLRSISDQRKSAFLQLCNIVGKYRDSVHNLTFHTWGQNKLDGKISETLGAAVTGFKGHGQAGQAKGRKRQGEWHRGDYKSLIRQFLERFGFVARWERKYLKNNVKKTPTKSHKSKAEKFAHEKVRDWELRIRPVPILGRILARNTDCKAEDRIYPGVDFRIQGTPFAANGLQYIRLDYGVWDQNILQQWNFYPIFAAVQGNPVSVQQVEQRGDGNWYAIDNFGTVSERGVIRVTENGVMKWTGQNRRGDAGWSLPEPWQHNLKQEHTISISGLRDLALGQESNALDLRNHNLFSLSGSGNLPSDMALTVTVYHASERAVEKIVNAGGTVNVLGWAAWAEENDFQSTLPVGDYLVMSRRISVPDQLPITFRLQAERPRTHWKTTIESLEEMLYHGILIVCHHRDWFARECISVMMAKPNKKDRSNVINKIRAVRGNRTGVFESNWYLFPDNNRKKYYDGTYCWKDTGAVLLAQAVRTNRGAPSVHQDWTLTHWEPFFNRKNDIRRPKIRDLLLGGHEELPELPVYPEGFALDYSDQQARSDVAVNFFSQSLVVFYRAFWYFADLTNTSKNIGFSTISEDIVRLYFGFRGSRVESGADAYEFPPDSLTPLRHEVKVLSGRNGDFMGTVDKSGSNPLGDDLETIQSWRGFHHVKVEDRRVVSEQGASYGNLSIALLAPSQETMRSLHSICRDYHRNRPNSEKFQFHGTAYDENYITNGSGNLSFVRVVEFVEHGVDDHIITHMSIPNLAPCDCYSCALGGFRWEPTHPLEGQSKHNWRSSRVLHQWFDLLEL